jgi:Lon protease (S16) C-terminal proteolytic domain
MRAVRVLSRLLAVLALIGALAVHHRFTWIPLPYLGALIVLPVVAWRVARWPRAPRPVRWTGAALGVLTFVALCPVPWMRAQLDNPPGSAWRLDGRLLINGTTVDPPGSWYWLTAGRPPIVAEVVRGWFSSDERAPTSMRGGRRVLRPAVTEPAAAAVGLRRAGWTIDESVIVEASDPTEAGLPAKTVVVTINDVELTTRDRWYQAVEGLGGWGTFTTADGTTFEFEGSRLPFRHVDVVDEPDARTLDVAVGGRLARTWPGSWFRDLALGSSHGLMVALVSYAYASGDDLAGGRAIAGTGIIRYDGSVGSIGGLRSKATAARDVGADVLLFPAQQASQLEGFDPGAMQLIPVTTLDEAIAALGG